MIELRDLTKRYGATTAVDHVELVVRPGLVTGFLGPNGSGKSTTMRLVLGLDRPSSGRALVGGVEYLSLRAPLRHVGASLDPSWAHPGRTGRAHLRVLARANRIDTRRVPDVLAEVELTGEADRRIGGYSLGMRQRLSIAGALLGDPAVLLFDEPLNGLDTQGIRWTRALLRRLAADGRTVLVSSHIMSEMELVADRVAVIGRGRLLADMDLARFVASASAGATLVRATDREGLALAVRDLGAAATDSPGGGLLVSGVDAEAIGRAACARGVALTELRTVSSTLEDVYVALTRDVAHRPGEDSP